MKCTEADLTQTDWFRRLTCSDNSIEACAIKVDLINIWHAQTEQFVCVCVCGGGGGGVKKVEAKFYD